MTRKHYKAIALAIKDSTLLTKHNKRSPYNYDVINKDSLINDLCDIFISDNIRFDYRRFDEACNDV